MDIEIFNEILRYVECPFQIVSEFKKSGQRVVYHAARSTGGGRFVLKTSPPIPSAVARIKRELKILKDIDSTLFPKIYYEYFISDDEIENFLDSLDDPAKVKRIALLPRMSLFVTVEQYIDHVGWDKASHVLSSEENLIPILEKIFYALNLLWEKKVVHRDFKPDNLLLKPDLTPVIIDLGIAKILEDDATELTRPGDMSPHTPLFAAPEQLVNSKTEITHKSDQYSVGATFYFLLSQSFPYGDGRKIGMDEVRKKIRNGEYIPLDHSKIGVSKEFCEFLAKTLEALPFKRFRTIQDISDALNKLKGKK